METESESMISVFLVNLWIARNCNCLVLWTTGQSDVNVIIDIREASRFGELDITLAIYI